jgi:hypothetical protein
VVNETEAPVTEAVGVVLRACAGEVCPGLEPAAVLLLMGFCGVTGQVTSANGKRGACSMRSGVSR